MNNLLYRRKLVKDICAVASKIQIELPSLYLNLIETPEKKGDGEAISNTDYENYLETLQILFRKEANELFFKYRG
ncbi:MAG: hypothetical protein RLZZ316_2789 [Bacteroidota bacterium]|jgi:hypothetical protein